jgi:hypothetical protein
MGGHTFTVAGFKLLIHDFFKIINYSYVVLLGYSFFKVLIATCCCGIYALPFFLLVCLCSWSASQIRAVRTGLRMCGCQ